MIAYDKIQLDNLLINEHAKRFKRLDLITEDELVSIAKAKQPAYHRTNIFIRIGVLLLTVILTFCSYGLIFLFFNLDVLGEGLRIAVLFFSFTTYAALEFFIRKKKHFASGVDDGLLFFAWYCFAIAVALIINPDTSSGYLIFSMLLFIVSMISFLRYTDNLVAAVGSISFLMICFYVTMQLGEISKLIMPFVIILVSGCLYLFVSKQANKYELRFWSGGMKWMQWVSLLCFYAAGNYYVVREAGLQFFKMQLKPGGEIPFYIFFYAFTILIPLVYVYVGLKKKDNILLSCGLILIAASIATIRYYYSIMPLEIALLLGGSLLLAITYFTYNYLKTPKHGFTLEEDKGDESLFSKDVEAIMIAQALAQQTTPAKSETTDFGGGKFGGGGAGEKF